MRCLVLADQYLKDSIIFAAQDLKGNANQKIIDKGYQLTILSNNSIDELEKNINKFKVDLTIFDHYDIDDKFEKKIKEKTNVQILSIDDTYEKHHCDILLNHNIYASVEQYKALVPDFCEVRCGEKYTLIRDEFKKLKINKRPINKKIPVIFVSFGGSDASNIGLTVLKTLADFDGITINFATTSANQNIDKLQDFAKHHQNINICIDCNIAEMMNDSDYAIIASSVTTYEAMYLDLPFLAIQTADNQSHISDYLIEHNYLFVNVKTLDSIKPLIQALLDS
jgi:UDP-2,4-diacetamido-2,4,6-trideoxy-beta-L-altropyranose hydrolase